MKDADENSRLGMAILEQPDLSIEISVVDVEAEPPHFSFSFAVSSDEDKAISIGISKKDGSISGIIISFSKEINIDDYVKIANHKGKILDINLTKVTLLNEDDDIIYIPNDKVYMSEIINYTKKEIKKVSIDFELNLDYHTTIESLEKSLVAALKDFDKYIEDGSYNIKIVDVYHDYLALKFQYKLKEVNIDIERLIRKKTIRLIANAIK
jgi:small-conductance mechanosensitive channel